MHDRKYISNRKIDVDKCVNNVVLYILQHTLTNTYKISIHINLTVSKSMLSTHIKEHV